MYQQAYSGEFDTFDADFCTTGYASATTDISLADIGVNVASFYLEGDATCAVSTNQAITSGITGVNSFRSFEGTGVTHADFAFQSANVDLNTQIIGQLSTGVTC